VFTTTTLIFIGIYIVLFLLRRVLGAFWSISGAIATIMIHLRVGIDPPIPGSVVAIYSMFVVIAALLYILASENTMREFWAPIRQTIVDPRRKPILGALLVGIPALVAWRTYVAVNPGVQAPAVFRTVHPTPPESVSSNGESISTERGDNPLRALETSNAAAFDDHVWNGRKVYYENCYFCHGDELQADGHFAYALQPRPISFRDQTTIAMFSETFLFWRVAKGGPGLPAAATPWDSAMPAWETFLTNQEMWEVILYLYDRTGQRPRVKVEVK
jgi:hypothetical protein